MSTQQYNPVGQAGVSQPMVGQNGQVGPGQFPGMQMNPTPPQYQAPHYQQPMPGQPQYQAPQYQAPQQQAPQQQAPKSTVVEVIRSNYTTIALFEVSGGYDPAQQFPKALCFVMGVPGVKDPSKQSGRSYVQANKIVMKFSTQEIRSLGQSLINIATFKQAASPFVKHSDPSKNSYSQAGANQAQAKKLEAKFDQAKSNIVVTMNYGNLNVLIPIPLQDAYGLGHDLINIGNFSDAKLAEYKLAHKIGREEVTGIDYDPAGTEETHTQQYAQPQYTGIQPLPGQTPAGAQYQAPQLNGAQPQYTPEQIAYFQAQQAGANQQFPGGYPGAQ